MEYFISIIAFQLVLSVLYHHGKHWESKQRSFDYFVFFIYFAVCLWCSGLGYHSLSPGYQQRHQNVLPTTLLSSPAFKKDVTLNTGGPSD